MKAISLSVLIMLLGPKLIIMGNTDNIEVSLLKHSCLSPD